MDDAFLDIVKQRQRLGKALTETPAVCNNAPSVPILLGVSVFSNLGALLRLLLALPLS